MGEDSPAERTIGDTVALDQTRRTIARRLSESYREAVHVTVSRVVDVAPVQAAATSTEDASLVDLILLALSRALDAHPTFNATFDGETITCYDEHNIAYAVDTDAGLIAPVIGDVSAMGPAELAATRRERIDRARAGDHTMADLAGGTITVTNLGPLDVDSFTPIINPPQVAIVGLNRIRERATLADGELVAVPEMPIEVTFDHRVVDGADAARFLDTIVDGLAEADRLGEPV